MTVSIPISSRPILREIHSRKFSEFAKFGLKILEPDLNIVESEKWLALCDLAQTIYDGKVPKHSKYHESSKVIDADELVKILSNISIEIGPG